MAKVTIWVNDVNTDRIKTWATEAGMSLEEAIRDPFTEWLMKLTFQVPNPDWDLVLALEATLQRGTIERYNLWELVLGTLVRIIDRKRW